MIIMDIGGKKRPGRPTGSIEIEMKEVYTASLAAFAEQGFEATTMTKIADRLSISRSLLNYHFGSKENLWKKAMEYLGQQFITAFHDYKKFHKDLEGLQLLKVIIRQIVHFNANYPAFTKIIAMEMQRDTARLDWIIDHLLKPMFALTADLFKAEREENRMKRISAHHQSSILLGMINNIYLSGLLYQKLYQVDPFDEEEIEKHADAVIDIFFNGILTSTHKHQLKL